MTDIIFSFDTEDFTSSVAADAVVQEANLLKKHGIKGGFSVVGLLAKQLQNWGRQDVIDALKEHIIGNQLNTGNKALDGVLKDKHQYRSSSSQSGQKHNWALVNQRADHQYRTNTYDSKLQHLIEALH